MSSMLSRLAWGVLCLCFWQGAGSLQAHPQAPSPADPVPGLVQQLTKAATDAERETLLSSVAPDELPRIVKKLHDLALEAYRKQDYRTALSLDLAQRIAAQKTGDRRAEAVALSSAGQSWNQLGEMSEALQAYETALTIAKAGAFTAEEAGALVSLGVTLHNLARNSEAETALLRSQELFRSLRDELGVARTLNNLGNVYLEMGDLRKAADFYGQCLQLSEKIGQPRGVGFSLNNLGTVYHRQGELDRSLDYYERALAVKKTLGDKRDIATSYQNLGLVQHELNRDEQALKSIEQGLAIAREIGSKRLVAQNLHNRSLVYMTLHRTAEAEHDLEESLGLSRQTQDMTSQVVTLDSLAHMAYEQGNLALALNRADEAVEIAKQVGDDYYSYQAQEARARVLLAMGRKPEAKTALEKSLQSIEAQRSRLAGGDERSTSFFGEKLGTYQILTSLLVSEGERAAALSIAERSKARVLLDALRSGRAEVSKAMTDEEIQRERQLSQRVSVLNRQISTSQSRDPRLKSEWEVARKELESFRDRLYFAHPDLRAQRGEAEPLTLAQVAELLPDRQTALLEYAELEDGMAVFAITKGADGSPKINVHRLKVPPKTLVAETKAFRDKIASRDLDYRTAAAALYRRILAPIESDLANIKTLVIVPDGPLWQLPFQALVTGRGRHLLEERTIFYAPSLTVLWVNAHARKPAAPGSLALLAMGNPTQAAGVGPSLRGAGLSPLPDAEREVRELGKLYGRASRVYTGPEAREDRLRTEGQSARIIHLATHGILNDSQPLYSYVALAKGRQGSADGLLEAREMMQFDLHAQLVSLSACETAGGRVSGGEGMIGMSWALQVAGTPAVVVSQWKVDSASAADLMLTFHKNLQPRLEKSLLLTGKAEALRQASLAMLRNPQRRHPFYWSSFVLIGDGY